MIGKQSRVHPGGYKTKHITCSNSKEYWRSNIKTKQVCNTAVITQENVAELFCEKNLLSREAAMPPDHKSLL